MTAGRPRRNPFRRGRGTKLPLLAGRDAELSLAETLLDRLAAGEPPRDLLRYGPWGNGKTALLDLQRDGVRAWTGSPHASAAPESRNAARGGRHKVVTHFVSRCG